ncbi:hypothetical protein QAD02_007296 [Eretmocerus hayati]|uniref:Uncharacterized protein n=1 Tax=Eretmocerus hayati TaxID=131215 RepID=A0ACC2N374_9HYME|nr:hypothetical protein QAD02_007296 [Eretmocerus hayati]
MPPFLHDELQHMIRNIMARYVKELKGANLLHRSLVDLGFENRDALQAVGTKYPVETLNKFRKDCKKCLTAIVKKLIEKSPLLYNMPRYISCLSPYLIADDFVLAEKRLVLRLEELSLRNKIISNSTADRIKQEFITFFTFAGIKEEFKEYRRSITRLDHLWMKMLESTASEESFGDAAVGYTVETILVGTP